MAKQVLIPEPRPYFCYQDEKHFFGWLEGIRGVTAVVGCPQGLVVQLAGSSLSREGWRDLIGLFRRYGLDMRALQPLVTRKDEAWLKSRWGKDIWKNSRPDNASKAARLSS